MGDLDALIQAQQKALALIQTIESQGLIQPGISEKELSESIMKLAQKDFDIDKYWHKRIVRAGVNTLCPYDDNPPNRVIEADDIVFIDLGPILEKWEADLGRTYVIGNNPLKIKLKNDVEKLWHETAEYFFEHPDVSSAELYRYVVESAQNMGWEFGGEIAGHLIGQFPHEHITTEKVYNYIHPDNNQKLSHLHHWILEIHLIDRVNQIGGFYEQLLVRPNP